MLTVARFLEKLTVILKNQIVFWPELGYPQTTIDDFEIDRKALLEAIASASIVTMDDFVQFMEVDGYTEGGLYKAARINSIILYWMDAFEKLELENEKEKLFLVFLHSFFHLYSYRVGPLHFTLDQIIIVAFSGDTSFSDELVSFAYNFMILCDSYKDLAVEEKETLNHHFDVLLSPEEEISSCLIQNPEAPFRIFPIFQTDEDENRLFEYFRTKSNFIQFEKNYGSGL
ncbi:MAG: hypothetical protein ACRCXZ_10085 [Patescibacteria group bacterium]